VKSFVFVQPLIMIAASIVSAILYIKIVPNWKSCIS